jgi:hypothetical protein
VHLLRHEHPAAVIEPNAIRVRDSEGKHLTVVCSNKCAYAVPDAADSEPVVTFGGTCATCEKKLVP